MGVNEIDVRFECHYSEASGGLFRHADPSDQSECIYSHLGPDDAQKVFPCFDQPNIKADFTVLVIVPDDWAAFTSENESGGATALGSLAFDEQFQRFNLNKEDILSLYEYE